MNGHLIVVTGAHGCARKPLETFMSSRDDTAYFACLEESLSAKLSQAELDAALMQKEFERDAEEILPLLESGGTAVVEQWHIGNLARARLRTPKVAQVYEERLTEHLSRFEGIKMQVFYVSVDVEKWVSDVDTISKRDELRELAFIIKHQRLPLETIDGEDSPRAIKKRVLYLLTKMVFPVTDQEFNI